MEAVPVSATSISFGLRKFAQRGYRASAVIGSNPPPTKPQAIRPFVSSFLLDRDIACDLEKVALIFV
jgi:hypothetical protein